MGLTERPDSPAMGAQPEQRGAPRHPELREGLGAPSPEPEAAGGGGSSSSVFVFPKRLRALP